jgi:serine protease AprX
MAGIIAGSGAGSDGRHAGMAPAADLLSIKVAGRDGSSDVSKVLAAIQWAVENRDRYGIRILNLSLGTDSKESWQVDPFNYAVERAWDAGIVVVVAASNRGPSAGTISKPGDDPWVLTVGAVDDRGTAPDADDRLPDFSSRGPTGDGHAKPDVVAPGARLVSLEAPGSAIAERFPTDVGGGYRRGSGTSMAAAAVSGGVALLLEQHAGWSPDQVKAALRATAGPTASRDIQAVGSGTVDLPAAAGWAGAPPVTGLARSSGRGSLDASRGGVRVRTDDPVGVVLSGSLTAQMLLWDPVAFTTGDWTAPPTGASTTLLHRWHGTTWYGNNWQGNNWQGNNWQGNNWQGDWEGATSADGSRSTDVYGRPWLGAAWLGAWE